MRTADFHFELPPELIAQFPAERRDASRLLVLHRESGRIEHGKFSELGQFLRAGDVLVLNDSRVIRARLRGVNVRTGGAFEILLLEQNAVNDWWAMLRPGKRGREGTEIVLNARDKRPSAVRLVVAEKNEEGHRRVRFLGTKDILQELEELGEVPLPPYIRRDQGEQTLDGERYQTVFALNPGSVAAPTAGLHFTESILANLRARGVQIAFVTLHVGAGTFAPVKSEVLASHKMHSEHFSLGAEAAAMINGAKENGRRVLAVGTTSCRVLETVASRSGRVQASQGKTKIFIYPPYEYKVVDALLTNFHLPHSTLLMLVSAFAAPGETRGHELVMSAYSEAIHQRYRFFSYGDAMLIL